MPSVELSKDLSSEKDRPNVFHSPVSQNSTVKFFHFPQNNLHYIIIENYVLNSLAINDGEEDRDLAIEGKWRS